MYLGALLFWLLLLSPLPGPSVGQFSQQPQPQTFTVRGKVVNSATGEPVGGALVQLFAGSQRSRLTGVDGQFAFEGVSAGTFNLQARKPGFFFAPQLPVSSAPPVMVTAGPDQPPATIKLIPEGIIYGRIVGDGGEPIESLPVRLLSERIENGKRVRSEFRGANTDEEGQFRIAELPPGKYFVFAGPNSIPASFPARLSQGGARGYAAVFYPGVPEMASAAAIEIIPGKHAEINWNLSSQPVYRISGTVSGILQNQGINLQVINSAGQPLPSGFEFDSSKGTFRTQWLPAGPCTLSATMFDPATQQEYLAERTLNLTSDVTGVHLVLVPNITVPVNFRLETTRDNASSGFSPGSFVFDGTNAQQHRQAYIPARVVLAPQNQSISPRQRFSETAPGDEISVVVRNVPPGIYSVEVFPNGAYYVESARSGSLDLMRQNLTIGSGAAVQPIEVVLRDDFATLEGTVSSEQSDVSGAVIAIPEDAPQQAHPFNLGRLAHSLDPTRPAARFEISQLRPGAYEVLAVDDPSFEYANPQVLQKHLSQAQKVFLAPNQRAKVSLELVRVGD